MRAETLTKTDILVIGAGMGGLYAVHKFRSLGVDVLCVEAAEDVGGVWYHNSYPGARVDLESETFCYLFDDELYASWQWSERYAAQPEILAYLNHVADRYDLRRSIQCDTRVTRVEWIEAESSYRVSTSRGEIQATYVVAATGQLSEPRTPDLPGIERFGGQILQTSKWPKEPVELAGKRVGVLGTGSSGVQVITAIAEEVDELHVFQRTANYSVPAFNRRRDVVRHAYATERMGAYRAEVFGSAMGFLMPPDAGPASAWTDIEQEQLLEQRFAVGGQSLLKTFSDQGVDWDTNGRVGDFIREKIKERLDGREDLQALVPDAYPIGTRRLCVDTGYYEQYLRDNVHLVDLQQNPIAAITQNGVAFADGREVELDVLVLALGFEAFTGALFAMNIVGRGGIRLDEAWKKGPETYLGIMAHDFPNLFFPTGPGGPSVLANMFAANVQAMDFVAGILERVWARGDRIVWPDLEPQATWSEYVQTVAKGLIRYQVNNYFVHRNEDGSKVYLPFTGGFGAYSAFCDDELAANLPSFTSAEGFISAEANDG